MRFAHDFAGGAAHAALRPLTKAAQTVKRHLRGIAGVVTLPITNAERAGAHSMIQSLRHRAQGLPDSVSLRTPCCFIPVDFNSSHFDAHPSEVPTGLMT